jgi:hypothetical protein
MKIKMVVFDMAGTTVDEDNVVYKTLQEAIVKHSISVTLDEVLSYGAGKEKLQAIMDILDQTNHPASPGIVKEIYNYFINQLAINYNTLEIKALPNVERVFKELIERNIKVVLNTGYNRETAESLIDKLGRKQLMYIGSVGYIISLSLVAYFFGIGYTGTAIPIFFFLFIASHAIGQGTVIWVFISEIFPTHLRADGSAFGCGTHWVLAAAIPAMVPFLFKTIGATTVFAIFAIMMVFQLIFVWKMMPETKGVNLEELQKQLTK